MRTNNAVLYTIDTMLTIALGYKAQYHVLTIDSNYLEIEVQGIMMKFFICNEEKFQQLLYGNVMLNNIDSYDQYYQLPILKLENNEDFFSLEDSVLSINFDIISLPFILLSGLDEFYFNRKDLLDRFPYKDSIIQKYNLIRIPLVDEYAFLLRKLIMNNFSHISVETRASRIIPTHDIDDLYRFTGPIKTLKSLGYQLIQTFNIVETFEAFVDSIKTFFDKKNDPYFKGILKLLQDSENANLQSCFFFMTAPKTDYDRGQEISDERVKHIFKLLKEKRMLIGIHPGFYTYQDFDEMKRQISLLKKDTSTDISISRQHYLRFDRKKTFDIMEQNDILIDYTLGFAEEEGFRCGTSHEFNPYNIKEDKPYNIIERPLIAMDVTLQHVKKYNTKEAFNSLCELYNVVKRTEGNFIILWHNAYVHRERKWYNEVYSKFIFQRS